MNVIRWTGPGKEPVRAYSGDAGFDLTVILPPWDAPGERTGARANCPAGYALEVGEEVNLSTGVFIEPTPNLWCWLVGRSSCFRRGLLVNQAIIDSGYRGELFVMVRNIGTDCEIIQDGDRLAQVIPMQLESAHTVFHHVRSLADSDRGEHGFGSSGR